MTSKPTKSHKADARSGAYEILQRVEEGGYADLLLDSWLTRHPGFDPRERGLLTELVYGGTTSAWPDRFRSCAIL